MKKFMRALRRHSAVDPPPSPPPPASPPPQAPDAPPTSPSELSSPVAPSPPPSPSRSRRRHMRLSILPHRSNTELRRNSPSQNAGPRTSEASPPNTPPQPPHQPAAPVFYDMYENPPTLPPLSPHARSAHATQPDPHAEHNHLTLSREQLQSALPQHYSSMSSSSLSNSVHRVRARHNSFGPLSSRQDPGEYRRLHASQPLRHRMQEDLRRENRRGPHRQSGAAAPRQRDGGILASAQSHPQLLNTTEHLPALDEDVEYSSQAQFQGTRHFSNLNVDDHNNTGFQNDFFDIDDEDSPDDDEEYFHGDGDEVADPELDDDDVRRRFLVKTHSSTGPHESSDAQQQFGRLRPRRSKTTIPDSVLHPNRRRIEGGQRASVSNTSRTVQASPFSSRRRARQAESSAPVEAKLYSAYTDALHEEARGREGGLRTIVNLLTDCDGNAIVIEKAAMAIGMLSENDAATRDVFGQYSAVQALLQSLSVRVPSRQARTAIVEMVSFAMSSLLLDSPRNVRLFEMFDGPHRMGRAASSALYETRPVIAQHALRALAELKFHPAHGGDGSAAPSLAASGSTSGSTGSSTARTIRYVLRCMSTHEHRAGVQELGLDVLRTLIARAGAGAVSGYVLRLCSQAAGTAFKLHNESKEVQWQCLSLLCDLEEGRESMLSLELDVVCFFGALRMVIAEAKSGRHKGETGKALGDVVQRAVDVAVRNGWRSNEFKEAAVDAGAVETILAALDVFEGEPKMMDKICTILRVLLQSDEGRFRMNSVSSACAILAGIESVNARAVRAVPDVPDARAA